METIARPFGKTGYRPPLAPDARNYILEKAQPIKPFPPVYKTDLTNLGVYMQEQIPDCVENAVTLVHRYYELNKDNLTLNLSRRFLAALTVQADGFPISNGTSLLNALKTAKNKGICEAQYFTDDHTLDEATFSNASLINSAALANGLTHTIANYAFLSDLSMQGIKNAIYQNGVVLLGLKIDKNWWTAPNGTVSWAEKDILPLRPPTDQASMSGHAAVAYAYDETYIYVWNSFSDQWGFMGHGWFGANYLPYIYEGATILDLSPKQAQAVTIANTVGQLTQVENNTPDPTQKGIIQRVIDFLAWYISDIFAAQ